MTTIVGVLNKRAVAIAADSAVTIGSTHKVMNTGNKIFALSKHAPVGIAIYGNADMMGTPWEVIIKCYRRQLKDKKFLYLNDYVTDFIEYLRCHEFFASSKVQKDYLSLQMESFYDICESSAKKRANFAANPTQALIDELNDCKQLNQNNPEVFQDFQNYDYSSFIAFVRGEIEGIISKSKFLQVNTHFDIFAESYYYYMRIAKIVRNGESGLVFVGYGEEEIYPCLYNLITTLGFDHKLQFRQGEDPIKITNEQTTASIVPFAQVEATQTVIRGINPTFYNIISNNFTNVLGSFRKMISDLLRNNNMSALATQIDKLDVASLTTTFTKTTRDEFLRNYTRPLVQTIGLLGISDMANVAESLVALTSLVHRMSPKEESVGGPVDVAVISKGDGFIWIKRKHYFDPSLNAHFFSNYNND